MRRFYLLDVQPDLFGQWSFIRKWGRVGQPGQARGVPFPTEREARALFGAVDVYVTSFRPMKHTLTGRDERTMMKLVVARDTGKVVGCHLLGEDAGQASVVDAALIAFFYGTMAGFLQCVSLATAEGVAISDLLRLSGPFFSRFIANAVTETGERIAEGRYGDPQSSLDTHLGGIDLLVLGSSQDAGIDTSVVTAIRDSFARGVAAGHGADDTGRAILPHYVLRVIHFNYSFIALISDQEMEIRQCSRGNWHV